MVGTTDVVDVQRRGIAECLAQVTFHLRLRGEVELLEKFWTDGNAACSLNLPQCSVGVMCVVKVLDVVVIVWIAYCLC